METHTIRPSSEFIPRKVLEWIPIIGRFFEPKKFSEQFKNTKYHPLVKALAHFENTLAYSLVGLVFGVLSTLSVIPFLPVLFVILLVWISTFLLEIYLITSTKFSKTSGWSRVKTGKKKFFTWITYHAFWYMIAGVIVGYYL